MLGLLTRVAGLYIALCFAWVSGTPQAAEFTWFSNVEGREGWIEFAAGTSAFQTRIHVLPRLRSPDGTSELARVRDVSDGVVIEFSIDSSNVPDAQSFAKAVVMSVAPGAPGSQYQVNAPRPRAVRVDILQDGEVLGTVEAEEQERLPTVARFAKKIACASDRKEELLRGNFQLRASLAIPTSEYASVSVNIKEEMLASYKIDALKSVVSSARTSGGKFFFLDWRHKSVSTVINQSIQEQRSANASRETSVITVDATDDMIARIDKLLGFAPLSREEFIANHIAAASQAEAAGNHSLAELHRDYAAKADDPTPRVQTELLERAFAALSGPGPSLALFLARGIQFSETSASSAGRYQGFGVTDTSATSRSGYTEMRLKTSMVRYRITAGPYQADEASIRRWFRTARPNEETATEGLKKAIDQDNLSMLYESLAFNPDVNATLFGPRTPLMYAAQACKYWIAEALLKAGANPFLQDDNGKTAMHYADVVGCSKIKDSLHEQGDITVTFILAGRDNLKLIDAQIEEYGKEHGSGVFTVRTSPGSKLFRALVTAEVTLRGDQVLDDPPPRLTGFVGFDFSGGQTKPTAPAAFPASVAEPAAYRSVQPDYFAVVSSGYDSRGRPYRTYRFRDIVRIPLDAQQTMTASCDLYYDRQTNLINCVGYEKGTLLPSSNMQMKSARQRDLEKFRVLPDKYGLPNPTLYEVARGVCIEHKSGPLTECLVNGYY